MSRLAELPNADDTEDDVGAECDHDAHVLSAAFSSLSEDDDQRQERIRREEYCAAPRDKQVAASRGAGDQSVQARLTGAERAFFERALAEC